MCGGLLKNIFSVKIFRWGTDLKYLPTIFVSANDTMGCRISGCVTNIHVNPDNTSSTPPPLLLSHPDANGTLDEKHMRGVTLRRIAWGGDNVSHPWGPEAATATAFIGNILMMQPEALSSTDNLHNCSHCLNHRDHQQASLDISLSGFHHPMIVIVMTSSWWIPHHWPVSVALSPSSHSRLTRNHLLHLWLGTFDLVTL